MKVYTVHEAPGAAADRIDRAQHVQFVPDNFNWQAALFGPFELLIHHLYVGLAIYLLASTAVLLFLLAVDAQPAVVLLAVTALHVIVGFEFGELKRQDYDHRGWVDLGLVSGRSLRECERRFFEAWLPRQPLITGLSHSEASPVVPQAAQVARRQDGWTWRPWLSRRH